MTRRLPPAAVAPAPTTAPPATVAAGPSADVTVWCGPDPRNPAWRSQMVALATIGVTAVHGRCRTPPAGYMLEGSRP